eukprot:COSAG05_NODE_4814_length_1362_cov_0.882819_1_plen_98_part_00
MTFYAAFCLTLCVAGFAVTRLIVLSGCVRFVLQCRTRGWEDAYVCGRNAAWCAVATTAAEGAASTCAPIGSALVAVLIGCANFIARVLFQEFYGAER